MKLYITPGSPYARIARIVMLEKGLESRVEVVAAQTRRADSPYYKINPSGRVPYLERDDGVHDARLLVADSRTVSAIPLNTEGTLRHGARTKHRIDVSDDENSRSSRTVEDCHEISG